MSNSVLAKMAVVISAQTAEFLGKMTQAENRFQKFGNTATKVGAGLGIALGGREIIRGVGAALDVFKGFETTMSEVRAITGATGKDFQSLEKDALKLGSSTRYTAKQVGELQVAYGRLGFSTQEILQATKATLALAAATGEDLAKSADVAGSTVRGFGLDASETQRVVDVMASSFNKTALGLDNFTESMKYVAPVAAAAGATVEETTALLGVLADAGVRGSMAGTSLRKIFTDMSKDGRPLQERLAELGKKGITMADAMDEVGRTAQTSLLILTKNTDKTNELAKAFEMANGEALAMARTMSNNLTGDVTKLTSAWEGLILKIGDSEPWRRATQAITAVINEWSGVGDMDEELRRLAQYLTMDGFDVSKASRLVGRLKDLREVAGVPIDAIATTNQLAEKYNLTDEQSNKLYQTLLEVNTALSFQEKTLKLFNEFAQRNGYTDLTKAVDDYKQSLYEKILADQMEIDKQPTFRKFYEDRIAAYRRMIDILADYEKNLVKTTKAQEDQAGALRKEVVTIDTLQEKLKGYNESFEATSIKDTGRLQALAREAAALDEKIKKLQRIKQLESANLGSHLEKYNPDSVSLAKFNDANPLVDMDTQLQSAFDGLDRLAVKSKYVTQEINKAVLDMSGALASSISQFANEMGRAIGGDGNIKFGESIIRALASFAAQVGSALIGIGTAMLAAKAMIKNPYTAIAAGVALVALAGVLDASVSKSQDNFNSGRGASSAATSNNSRRGNLGGSGLEIAVALEGVIEGDDFRIITNRNRQKNGRTRII